ncbi:MAG TPA: hypothetical protein ENJ11_05750 [Gammaproteobacteria bacterium]|nr:hypothetical protein [Gammaproteobacteria bacterium]
MLDFSFNATALKDLFHSTLAPWLQEESSAEKGDGKQTLPVLLEAMDQAIDVMARVDADSAVKAQMSAESLGLLEEKDISQIGQYALDLLEGMVALVQQQTGEQPRELLRLSIPISLWVARHGGRLSQIDMVVNSLAGLANEIVEPHLLEELTGIIREVIDAVDDDIRRDVEQTNMMRPWRVLNLNYGIVATRSHNPELIEQAYDALIKNLPNDARQFFREGMQQMDIIGYPEEVREVVQRYNDMWGAGDSLH